MKIPKIVFTPEFEEKKDSDKILYLKQLASTMNNAADVLQKEKISLLEELDKKSKLLENAEKALMIQKDIVSRHLTSSNLKIQELSNQILELQTQLRNANQMIEKMKADVE